MFKIEKIDGTDVGVTDEPLWIKKSLCGALIATDRARATAIALDSVAYNLDGHNDVEGGETVLVYEMPLSQWAVSKKKEQADTDNLVVDHEYRLLLLELSAEETANTTTAATSAE